VSNQDDKQVSADVAQLNAELTRSMERCRKLLFDFRSDLAANCNMPELLDEQTQEKQA
jgi:hypothetical protein